MTKNKSTAPSTKKVSPSTSGVRKRKNEHEPWKKSPVIGMNGYNLEAGDNAKFVGVQYELFNMPDIDMKDNEQVCKRLSDYFDLYISRDMKPTVAGMALALNGHSRQWLSDVANNRPLGGRGNYCTLPSDVTYSIKKAYKMLENLHESYMDSGKMNPVTGIFLAKNNFGYLDKVEHVVTPNIETEQRSVEEITAMYTTPEQLELKK